MAVKYSYYLIMYRCLCHHPKPLMEKVIIETPALCYKSESYTNWKRVAIFLIQAQSIWILFKIKAVSNYLQPVFPYLNISQSSSKNLQLL